MKVCRICLSQDGRLYSITSNGLHSLYYQLIGIVKLEVDVDKGMPQWVCAECGLRLMSYNKLRQKSLWSHHILTDLLNRVTHITEEDLNQIDREKYKLQSNLTYCILDQGIVQEYEVEIKETDKADRKSNVKIEEFFIDFKAVETVDIPNFKTEPASNESLSETAVSNTENNSNCDEYHSKTAVSNTENNSDCEDYHSKTAVSNTDNISDCESDLISGSENASISSNPLSTANKLLKSIPWNSLRTKSKTVQLNVLKQVDQLIDSLDKKPTKTDYVNDLMKQKTIKKRKKHSIEEIFTTQRLSLEEQIAEFENRKHSKNYTDAAYKCDDCLTGFNNEVTFARHKLTHSDKWGSIECNICKKRFRHMCTYRTHLIMHKTVYRCKECDFVTKLRGIALAHKFQHSGKVYNCALCDLEFVKLSSYMSHLRIKHVSQFVCEFCGFSFVSAKGVECHKNLKHSLEINNKIATTDGPTCATCNIKFVSDDALDTHFRVSHAQNSDGKKSNAGQNEDAIKTSIICELCGVETRDGTGYRKHYRRYHHNKSVTTLPARSTSGQPFVCELCGLVLKNATALRMHALVHTGQRPYECDYCHKTFTLKQQIRQHISYSHLSKRHLQSKRKLPKELYPCSVCGREFNLKSNRDRHQLDVHTAVRRFNCEICGSNFKNKSDLKTHTEHVHMKKPWPQRKGRRPRQGI